MLHFGYTEDEHIIQYEVVGEGEKSFLVDIIPVLKDVTEKRKETGRHPRPRYKVIETRDIPDTGNSNLLESSLGSEGHDWLKDEVGKTHGPEERRPCTSC